MTRKQLKKIAPLGALLLLAAMLMQACGGDGGQPTGTTDPSNAPEADEAVETTADPYLDDLPADLNLNGKAVTFLYREEVSNEFYTDTMNGDIVNDAIYESIRSVEERLNADIVYEGELETKDND